MKTLSSGLSRATVVTGDLSWPVVHLGAIPAAPSHTIVRTHCIEQFSSSYQWLVVMVKVTRLVNKLNGPTIMSCYWCNKMDLLRWQVATINIKLLFKYSMDQFLIETNY